MNSPHAVRCETRADLNAWGIGIALLSGILLFPMFDAVMEVLDGSPLVLADLAFFSLFCGAYVALLAWVAFRVQEWLALGDATLYFSPRISTFAPSGAVSPRR